MPLEAVLAVTQRTPLVHVALEWLAYFLGARLFFHLRGRDPSAPPPRDRLLLVAAALAGAALGSVALHLVQSASTLLTLPASQWISGKSVLGGLLGGTAGTELAKRWIGWRMSTGDAWVPALALGLVVGRLGCQLAGTWDTTYGSPTGSDWGWDYGDGVLRYPTGFIELAAVAALFAGVRPRYFKRSGQRFNAFLLGYCVLRFGLEFLKPPFGAAAADATVPVDLHAGLTAIQWTALLGAAWMTLRLVKPANTER
jgi:phosphatidylglycerol---prolipoprotein diacylglyceryl transferase